MARPTLLLLCLALAAMPAADAAESSRPASLDFTMEKLAGGSVDLADAYAGKVVLLVNVASRCGYTPQYAGLQELHERYAADGLAIVGVPCNQFGGQEPGSAEDIATFCEQNYGVEFDMLAKVDVNGADQCDLYAYLTGPESPQPGRVRWNFEKFLVGRDGSVVGRYSSGDAPTGDELITDIERELAK
ncbi:MAG: glutathione peroxidase [Planctomycetota bacterium]